MTDATPAGGAEGGAATRRAFVVLVTGPDPDALAGLARVLVSERLAACVNVVPSIASVYRWRGEVTAEGEALAILKTTGERLPALERRVRELHPYDLPEFVALEVARGSAAYLDWVAAAVSEEDRSGPTDAET